MEEGVLRNWFYSALNRAGLGHKREGPEPIVFHDLRHTFGTLTASAGVPFRIIQAFMGHASIQTTMRYADWAPDPTGGRVWVEKTFSDAESGVLTVVSEG